MIIEFLLSLLVLCLTSCLCILTSGGLIRELFEPALLIAVPGILAVMIFLSGYGKSFIKIFYTPKKIKNTELSELKKIDSALGFALRALIFICCFIMLISTIYFYLNFDETQTLGFNLSVLIVSILYMTFFGMLILTLKGKNKTRIIRFMADETEQEKPDSISKKQRVLSVCKILISLVLIIGLYYLIIFTSTVNHSGQEPLSLYYLTDIPGLIYIFIPPFLLLAISGNFKNFFKALKYAATNTKLTVSQKAVSIHTIQLLGKILLLEGIMSALSGYLGILYNLADRSMLGINYSVACVPLIYALIINLILLPVESKISLLVDSE